MRLRESATIAAPADAIWSLIADPVRQADWNPKVISVDRRTSGPCLFGERFDMIYRMRGRDHLTRVEVTACQPPQHITFLHRPAAPAETWSAEISYDLTPHAHHTIIAQTIDLTHAAIPWPLRVLIPVIHRFGQAIGEPYLHRLKRLAENPAK